MLRWRPIRSAATASLEITSARTGGDAEDAGRSVRHDAGDCIRGSRAEAARQFAIELLVRVAALHGEPGVSVSLEETPDELGRNVASLGFDLDDLVRR
jgi:hypothetical protein